MTSSDTRYIIEAGVRGCSNRHQLGRDRARCLRHRLRLRPIRVRQLGRVRAGQLLLNKSASETDIKRHFSLQTYRLLLGVL